MGIVLKQSESDIKRAIIEYLRSQKIFCWVNASTGIYDPRTRSFRKMNGTGMRKGVSDILGIYLGRLLAIEVKTKVGRLSPEQAEFLEEVNAHGGIAFMARSVDEVITLLSVA